MKFKFILNVLIAFCLFLTKSAFTQNYVEVGAGTIPNTIPIYSSWNYSWSALIYNHTDLGTAKTITKIGLNCVNGPKTVTNQKMYVKLSSNTVFANANFEDPINNGYVLVFQGDLTFQNGWNEITLTTPIVYDGVQNIMMHWENRWNNTYGPQFTSTASTINNTKNCGNDVNFPPPSQTGYLNPYPSSLTNMRFYYASTGPATPYNPLPADNATVVSVDTDLSWTLGANTTNYDLYLGTDPLNLTAVVTNATSIVGTNAYTIPGLLADSTMHYWKVVAKNGSQQESSPVWKFKTEVVIDQFPYNEGFEDSLVFHTYPIQSAWVNSPDFSWYEYNVNAHSGLLCAKSSFYITGNSATLRSPKVLLPPGYSISYFWRNTSVNKIAGHDTTYFEVSSNGGVSWVKLDTLSPVSQNATYIQRTHSLNSFAGNNFFFRFRHVTNNSGSANNIYLDDISIFQSSVTPTLIVNPANQNVAAPAGTTTFIVTSNSAWTVSSNQPWCTVTPSGSGNGSIIANFTENTTGTQRVAALTITVTGLTPIVVTVTQGVAVATLAVSPGNQNVTAPAGNTSFIVTSNSAWTSSSNQAWCTLTPSGNGNGTITATYTENTSLSPRTANITVTVAGLIPVVVTVTQEAGVAFVLANPTNQEVTYPAGTTNFAITSNSDWTAVSDAGWCVVTPSGIGNGTIFANYAENVFAAVRVANITISVSGISPVIVTVTQQGPVATLNITPSVQTVTYQTGVTSFAVTSNTSWTTSSDATWCVPTPSGSGSGVITVTYGQNETMVTRTATVTVNASGLPATFVQVVQLPSYVSVEEVESKDLKIFPNPASDWLNIEMPEIQKQAIIQIIDLTGNIVIQQQNSGNPIMLSVTGLSEGIYCLRVIFDNKLIYKMIVIE
ncbi:MAG: BACON domain-containing protein [Bacteroidales bacterium]